MDESGYFGQNGGSPGPASDDGQLILVSAGLVECPLEKDGSLLLSTLQSQLPGAAGLCYLPPGHDKKRAVRYDSNAGKLFAPTDGWHDRTYYVSYFQLQNHCALNAFDRYESATKTFESSIASVRKLLQSESGDFSVCSKCMDHELSTLSTTQHDESSISQVNGQEQVITSVSTEISQQIDSLQNETSNLKFQLEEKHREVEQLSRERDEMKAAREELSERIRKLEDDLGSKISELEGFYCQKQVETQLHAEFDQQRGGLNQEIENLRHQLEERDRRDRERDEELSNVNSHLADSVKQIAKLESDKWEQQQVFEATINELKVQLEDVQRAPSPNLAVDVDAQKTRDRCNSLAEKNAKMKGEICHLKEQILELKEKFKGQEDAQNEATQELRQQKDQLEWDIGEVRKWLDDSKWRVGELEAGLSHKEGELKSCVDKCQHLEWELGDVRKQLDESNWRKGELEGEVKNREEQILHLQSTTEQHIEEYKKRVNQEMGQASVGDHRNGTMNGHHDAVMELSDELKVVHQRKYELENEVAQMRKDLSDAQKQSSGIDSNAKELRAEIARLHEQVKNVENRCNHLEWEKNDFATRFHNGESRINWLEGELDGAKKRRDELEYWCTELGKFKEKAQRYVYDSFFVRKEPFCDREKWELALWNDKYNDDYVRTWFEVDVPNGAKHHVYLMGSFFNWEVGLLCTLHPHGKYGVWVDLPRGRHEFRYLIDGQWVTTEQFPKVPNDFGSDNNWRTIE